jgi:hypothetical protein
MAKKVKNNNGGIFGTPKTSENCPIIYQKNGIAKIKVSKSNKRE